MRKILDDYIRKTYNEDWNGKVERIEFTREQFHNHLSKAAIDILTDLITNLTFTTSNTEVVIDVQDVEAYIKSLESQTT